nr:50S ribosome-binding protein YggL [Psychromonas aquimarina]
MCSFTESRNLIMGGAGGTDTFTIYISSFDRYGSATEEDRSAFQAWLKNNTFIVDAKVDDLSDAYYGI